MHIYLAGPPGPDQVATKWLLEQRGYTSVTCDSDLLRKDYCYNRGMRPSPSDFRRYRSIELAQAKVCVLAEDINAEDREVVMAAARFAGIPVLRYAQLPAQAPSIMREDRVLQELVSGPARRPALQRAGSWGQRAARAFDERFGWFFTNGMKAAHRHA